MSSQYRVRGSTVVTTNSQNEIDLHLTDVRLGSLVTIPSAPVIGSNFGYTVGGYSGGFQSNIIDKFPFASDANASDVGDLASGSRRASGQTSSTHGYHTGGTGPSGVGINNIQKFPFASDSNASTVASRVYGNVLYSTGNSSSAHGYITGGSPYTPPVPLNNLIEKFPFASDTNSQVTSYSTPGFQDGAGISSTVNGYIAGLSDNSIRKFSFSNDEVTSNIGNLSTAGYTAGSGSSSSTHGYVAGGIQPPVPALNTINKFPFANEAILTTIGSLSGYLLSGTSRTAAQSSTTHGYNAGASPGNTIQKFPFATDANATDVGDLTASRSEQTGNQY